jgi:type II secretory pathway pseudopilin PulG
MRTKAQGHLAILRSQRGTSFFELTIIVGIIGVVAAITIPAMANALDRNKVFMSSELVAATVRDARLAAITRNVTYKVRFNCPTSSGVRVLVVTGDPLIDDAESRCQMHLPNDGAAMFLPEDVSYGTVPTLQVNGRGQISLVSGSMPLNITVTYESFSRTLAVTSTGRVTTPSS